jgi:hypothetical protein
LDSNSIETWGQQVTEERVITIRSTADALKNLRAAQARQREIRQPVRIVFEGWPSVHVNVKGRRYQSSLPTPLMRALLEYQVAINRIYADVAYGGSARNLDDDDRATTELNFVIAKGSSDGIAEIWKIFNALGEKIANKMNSKDSIKVLLSIALMTVGYLAFENYHDHQAKGHAQENNLPGEMSNHALDPLLLRHHPEIDNANDELSNVTLGIVRAVPDASSVRIGKQKYKRADIEVITERARATSVPGRADGNYVVKGLVNLGVRWLITLTSSDEDIEIKTDLYKSESAIALMPILQESFNNESSVFLELKVRKIGEQITQARILSQGYSVST